MPHLVEMQKKYGDKGLVVVTVALDAFFDDNAQERVLKFLRKKGVNLINLYLDDTSINWGEKFHFTEAPAYFVFNRQGKWTLFKRGEDDSTDYKAMEDLIVKSLAEK